MSPAQFTSTNGALARGLRSWIIRATQPLPVPLSPVSSTVVRSLCARSATWWAKSCMPDEVAQRIQPVAGRALHQQRLVDPAEPRLVGHARGGGGQVLHVHRLGQEVLGAELHGADRGGDVALAGEQDDGGVPLAQVLQHLHAVHARQPEIQDDDLGPQPVEGGQARLAAQLPGHLVAQALEVVPDAAQNVDIVIDEENGSGHAALPWEDEVARRRSSREATKN